MKITLSVICIVLSLAKAYGQTSQIRLGLKAGANFSTVTPSGLDQFRTAEMRPGFSGGVLVEIPIVKSFAIQPEFVYLEAGFAEKVNPEVPINYYDYHLKYLSVPLLIKYRLNNFSIFLGPQLSFLQGAEKKSARNEIGDGVAITTDVKSQINKSDFGGIIGLSYTGRRGFGLDGRYYSGFSNLKTDESIDFSGSDTYKSVGIQIGVHYLFGRRLD